MRRLAALGTIALLLVAAAGAVAGPVPLIDHVVGEIDEASYTTHQHTIEDMGLGFYGGEDYDQGYRGRSAGLLGPSGDSLGNQECRLYLADQFEAMGLTTTVTDDLTYLNVVGEITGTTRPEDIFIIGAHYDSVPGNPRPGGDDNASGTAAILELARILSQYEFEATIRLIGFNAEEWGMLGSYDYVSSIVMANDENVVGMISLDMILRPYNDNDPTAPVDLDIGCPASADDLAWVADFTAASNAYVPDLVIDSSTPFTSNWGSSDHQPFAQSGYAAFIAIENNVTEIRGDSNPYYHTSGDYSGGGAGDHFDYTFATNVAKAVAATLAVEAGIVPQEIQLAVGAGSPFVYQNAPVSTAGRNRITLSFVPTEDLNGNASYTTWLVQTGGSGVVSIEETGDPMVWEVVAGLHGQDATGEVELEAFIGGNEFGGEGSVPLTLTVRPIGDVDGSGQVNIDDLAEVLNRLNGLTPSYSPAASDLNGDGRINIDDQAMINNVLNGLSIP